MQAGNTPLHLAALIGNTTIVNELLRPLASHEHQRIIKPNKVYKINYAVRLSGLWEYTTVYAWKIEMCIGQQNNLSTHTETLLVHVLRHFGAMHASIFTA